MGRQFWQGKHTGNPENVGAGARNVVAGLASAREASSLPAILNMRDLVVFMVLIVVSVWGNNSTQIGGPAAFLYWILGTLTFLLPTAFVTQWLGRRFPGQGAPYLWASRIIGPDWGFFVAFCAWLPGITAVVSIQEGSLTFIQYFIPGITHTSLLQGILMLLMLLVATAFTCIPLRWLRYMLLIMVALFLSVFLFQGAAGVWWLSSGHAPAVDLTIPHTWLPGGGNVAVYGVVILTLLGVDIPQLLGNEIHHGQAGSRRATNYVWWGSAITFLAYITGTFAVMVIVPPARSSLLGANVEVIQIVFGPLAARIMIYLLAISEFASTVVCLLLYSRLLVAVAHDRRLPACLTRTNRSGVPVTSIVVQSAIIAAIIIVSFIAIPTIFGAFANPDTLTLETYTVLLAGSTALAAFSNALLFLFALRHLFRRRRRKRVSARLWACMLGLSLVGIAASLSGVAATVFSSWLPTLIPDGSWAVLTCSVILVSVAVGWIGSEVPRMRALLSEQKRVTLREAHVRAQLQEAYDQQQLLLSEVDRLYREQALAAVTDAITGLPNHRAIMTRIDEEVARCQRNGEHCAVIFVDLDHFKQVNDTWGHRAGDAILHEVARRLRNTLRVEDVVGRYGGEEFAVVLSETEPEQAAQAAERLRAAIALQPVTWQAEEQDEISCIPVTASFGLAIYGVHGFTREVLIECADKAMYQAKQSGRNRVCVADVRAQITTPEFIAPDRGRPQRSPPITVPPPPLRDETIAAGGDKPSPYSHRPATEIIAIQALTAAASAHDRGTDEHAHRMVQLAEATALKMHRSAEEIYLIRLAALFHDIGKIGIPDTILHKPGPLNAQEWVIMRRHPEIGQQIMEQVGGVFGLLASIVVAHHERWDGSGYPRGLAGEAIPISARILTIVDSYDAMTSRRPYREPLSSTEARKELQRCAGSQYDPTVVEAFLYVLDDMEADQWPYGSSVALSIETV